MFWRRKVKGEPTVEELQERIGRVERELRALQTEQIQLHDDCRRWMRRGVAVERSARRNQEPAGTATSPPAPPVSPARMSKARLQAWAEGRVWGAGRAVKSTPETNGEHLEGTEE